jgi:type I restriction enzyme S subunit
MIEGLKPHAAMKDSGVPWLGQVPEHWEISKLKRIAQLKSGESITATEIHPEGPYSVYGGNGLRGFTAAYTHEGDYVLMGRQGALCGNINYARGRFWASEHAVVAHPRGDFPVPWLGELLRIMNLNQYSIAAAQPGLSVERIEQLPIPYPPRDERAAVARFVVHADRLIRRYIAAKRRLIRLLEEQKQAIIHRAVTRGLDPTVRLKPSGIEWLGDIPAHWQIVPLKNMALIQSGITLGKNYARQAVQEYPYLRVANVQDGHLDLRTIKTIAVSGADAHRSTLKSGDVLMTEGGDPDKLGRGAIWEGQISPCLHQNHVFAVRPQEARLLPRFLAASLSSLHAKTYFLRTAKQTTNLASTNKNTIGLFQILLPPPCEQRTILDSLISMTSSVDEAIGVALRERDALEEYRTRLIADVVTGKLDVRAAAAALPESEEEPEPTEPIEDTEPGEAADDEADIEEAA